jgi:hypothetical protein
VLGGRAGSLPAARIQLALTALLGTPEEILADRAAVGRIMALTAGAPRYPLPGPTRAELLTTLSQPLVGVV